MLKKLVILRNIPMSEEILFKNDEYGHSIWWNKKPYTILVMIFDKDGRLIKTSEVDYMDYVFVPPGGIVKLK